MQILDDEIDTDEFFRDKDAFPTADDADDDTSGVRELVFDSKFDRNANFREMAEDFTATDDWE
jgi:hypothetical protein